MCIQAPLHETDSHLDEPDGAAVGATGTDRVRQVRATVLGGAAGGEGKVGAQVQDCTGEQGSKGRFGEAGIQKYDATGVTQRNPARSGAPVRSPERDPG